MDVAISKILLCGRVATNKNFSLLRSCSLGSNSNFALLCPTSQLQQQLNCQPKYHSFKMITEKSFLKQVLRKIKEGQKVEKIFEFWINFTLRLPICECGQAATQLRSKQFEIDTPYFCVMGRWHCVEPYKFFVNIPKSCIVLIVFPPFMAEMGRKI